MIESNEEALLALLKEAEILLHTAPIVGGSQFVGWLAWSAWTLKRLEWMKQLAKTLIIDLNKEEGSAMSNQEYLRLHPELTSIIEQQLSRSIDDVASITFSREIVEGGGRKTIIGFADGTRETFIVHLLEGETK